jgi:PAS domain S-box-containing protein
MLLHAIARDISERKRDEILIQEKTTKIEAQNEEYRIINEELEKTKQDALLNYERLQSLFRVTPSGIGLVKDRVIVEINQVVCQMLGYTAEELIGQNSKILYPSFEEYLSVGNEKYSQIQKYGTGTVETKWLKKNGELIDIMLSSTPLDMRDLTKGVTFTALDITELKNTIKELERSREDYIKLFEEHAAVKLLIDPFTGQIIDSNQAAANYYGWTREELRQMNIAQINILSKEQVKASMSKAYNSRKMYFEFKHKLADGSLRDIEVFASKISFNGREVLHSIIHDITKRKKAETDLVEAKEKAEESDRLKTAFLQNLSHEIRTPMNAIMGFSELLLQYTGNKAKIKSFTDIIIMRGNDLLNIINDILDISKIESGQLPVNLEETNLDDIFDELSAFYKAYRKRLKKEHIKFSLQFKCKPYRMLLTDQGKLKQIFINLITNAFKFTEEGKIEVGCTPQNDGNLLFHVSDTGIGIPADKYEIIFERFAQLHHGNKKNTGGTGLGLSIVKALVNLLGGTISVKSEPGKGSTFYFTIPYKPVSVSTQKLLNTGLPDDSGFLQKTLLLVEDDPYNAEYIREALVGAGISIHLAETGTDAIEKSISMPIDLVLMDIRLPDISGYEATRQIKVHKPQLKIIAQTAYASQDERFKALDAGCIDYLSKPTKKGTLLSTLKKYLD